jgi:serine protease Do
MGFRLRVPRGHFVAFVLSAAVAVTVFSSSGTPLARSSGAGQAFAREVNLAQPIDGRGTIQLAQLEEQFEAVARDVSASVVAISASLTSIDSDDAVRAESLNGDKLDAMLSRTTRTVGTGFVIDADGYILTNEHVVGDAGMLWVTMDDKRVYPAIIVGSDPRCDLAILKIPARDLRPVKFAAPDTVRRGMWTIAIGNPYGLAELGEMSMSVGIVSAVDRSLPKLSSKENRLYSNLIQTTAEINPGNSGGPLFDLSGQVIGINTAVILPQKQTNGIGFAMPIGEAILKKVDDLKQGREVVYGYLGVMVSNPTVRERRSAGADGAEGGVIIDSVETGSPAAGALKVGDFVSRIDGQPVTDSDQFVRLIGEVPVGRPTPLVLRRDGKPMTIEVATRKRQLPAVAVTRENQRFRWRGMLLGPIPANWDYGKEKRSTAGVMVMGIDANSPAVKEGIQSGAVITAIGGRAIASIVDVQKVINDVPPEQCRIDLLGGGPSGAAVASGN